MKLLTIFLNFITSTFSGFATQFIFKNANDLKKSQVRVKNSSKTQVKKNRVSGCIEVKGSEDTLIENNDIIN